MAKSKITAADVKKAAGKAAATARAKGKELAAKAGQRLGRANSALREMKHRRLMDGVEVVVGGAAAGALHGAGVSIDWGENMPDVPAGLPIGVGLIGVGVWGKSYDAQALGLGMAAFGVGRMVEDFTAEQLAASA